MNDYKTTLSSDFGDLKTDLELIATSISGAQARESQFTSIKRLADKIECTEDCFVSAEQADAIIRGLDKNDENVEALLDDINAKSSNIPAGGDAQRRRALSKTGSSPSKKSKRSKQSVKKESFSRNNTKSIADFFQMFNDSNLAEQFSEDQYGPLNFKNSTDNNTLPNYSRLINDLVSVDTKEALNPNKTQSIEEFLRLFKDFFQLFYDLNDDHHGSLKSVNNNTLLNIGRLIDDFIIVDSENSTAPEEQGLDENSGLTRADWDYNKKAIGTTVFTTAATLALLLVQAFDKAGPLKLKPPGFFTDKTLDNFV